jgi:hypothetical protein
MQYIIEKTRLRRKKHTNNTGYSKFTYCSFFLQNKTIFMLLNYYLKYFKGIKDAF